MPGRLAHLVEDLLQSSILFQRMERCCDPHPDVLRYTGLDGAVKGVDRLVCPAQQNLQTGALDVQVGGERSACRAMASARAMLPSRAPAPPFRVAARRRAGLPETTLGFGDDRP